MSEQNDIRRILSLLKRAIRSSGLSQKDVDRSIGVQPGYLSQVMIGRLDLKLKHLFRALDAIEVDPTGFFGLAFPSGLESDAVRGDVLNLLPTGVREGEPTPPSIDDEELQRLVARALAEELGVPSQTSRNGEPSRL